MKHNKKRNTAFIYETLTRELTKAIVEKDAARKNKIISILKGFFAKGAPLAEELQLYSALLSTANIHQRLAERLLHETKRAHELLEEETIFDAQSRIINAINKGLGKGMWGRFVPNFKSLASVSAIFNPKTSVKKRVLFEQAIVDKMSEQHDFRPSTSMASLDTLTYNSFIKKYNEKYGSLLQEQKELLNRFITSFADDGFELRLYLNEELSRLKGSLGEAIDTDLEPLISKKTSQVIDYLEEFRKRDFIEADLNKMLKTQQLARELRVHD